MFPHSVVQVYENMAADPPERVAIVRTQLTKLNDREFWEVGERSSNAEYLTPPQQRQLKVFFRMWEEGSVPASSTAEEKEAAAEEEEGLNFTPPGLVVHEDTDDSAWSEEHGAEVRGSKRERGEECVCVFAWGVWRFSCQSRRVSVYVRQCWCLCGCGVGKVARHSYGGGPPFV